MSASVLDLAVVAAYFAGITAAGAWFGRHTRTTMDFFLAGRRFPGSVIAVSCVATVVGSYSFVKYSSAGYRFGLASSQTYLNDWFWMPLLLMGWLPLLWRRGVLTVPDYFRRRFRPEVGHLATVLLLVYLVGYIGINLYTLGAALQALSGVDLLTLAAVVTLLCMVYEWTGGQTSVMLTDLFQGGLLLAAGLGLFLAGVAAVGGFGAFWHLLPPEHRMPLPDIRGSAAFNFAGIFWQDAMAGGLVFYFIHQGMLLRFLSARSPAAARRAGFLVVLVLMPLAAVAVSGAGWVGRAMAAKGLLPAMEDPDQVFVVVAGLLCAPGVFGFVVAALLAALMSTVDTLINASSALLVRDLLPALGLRAGDDAATLRAARWASLAAAAGGLALVPVFRSLGTIYEAHGAFTAAVTPPLAATLLLAILWPRFGSAGAVAALAGGSVVVAVSLFRPDWVTPLAHGIPPEGGYKYIRALFGLAAAVGLGAAVTWVLPASRSSGARSWTVWGTPPSPSETERHEVVRYARVRDAGSADSPLPRKDPFTPEAAARLSPELARSLGWRGRGEILVEDTRRLRRLVRGVRARVVDDPGPTNAAGEPAVFLPEPLRRRLGWREGERVRVTLLLP